MPGPHRKIVTQEESATVSEGGGGGQEKQVERRGLGTEAGAIGVREVGAASNGDSIRQPNGGPMLPEELRPSDLRQ